MTHHSSSERPLRVLLISHTCQSRSEGQPKAVCLEQHADLQLRVLVPARWKHYGRWRTPEPPLPGIRSLHAAPVRWAWIPGAQNYLHYYPRLAGILREFRPDVIDLWEEPWGLVSAHLCWLRDRILPSAKVISETEQNLSKVLPPPFEAFRRYVLKRADYLVGRSSEAVAVAREKGFKGPARVVGNGLDREVFRPMDRSGCRATHFPQIKSSDTLLLYAGRIVPEKGIADVIRTLDLLPDSVHLAFVGDGPFLPEAVRIASERNHSKRLILLPSQRPAALAEIMNAADIFVLPSRTTARWKEQFGRVVIEAQSCGTPVVGSSSGAIPDVIAGGGVLFPEGEAEALAIAIQSIRADSQFREKLSRNALQNAAQYSWQHIAGQMAEIYRELHHGAQNRFSGIVSNSPVLQTT